MIVDSHTVLGVRDVGDLCVQQQSRIVLLEKCRCLSFDNRIVTTLVPNVIVFIAELIEGKILSCKAEDKRALFWRVRVFEV